MSKTLRLPFVILILPALAASALADTVTLKSGERIEANIARETATAITLEIQVSSGITDERIVQKADVAKIDRIAPDETAYRAVMNYLPGKNSLTAAQYEAVLTALKNFATKFPASQHVADVQHAILAFETEKKRADAGELKLDGIWLTRQDVQKQRVQVGGAQAFNAMKNANAAGDAIGALNAFALLEKNFPGAKVMPDAIQLARQILVALKPTTDRALETYKIKKTETEQGFADASPADRVEMMAAYQRDQGMSSTGTLDGTVIQRLTAAAQ